MKLHRGDPPPGWEPVPGYKGFIRPKKSNGSDSDMSVENSVLAALLKNVKGDTGPVGPSGRDGRDGIDGKDGRDGKDGNPGPMGPRGERGEKGDTGPRGPAGKNGKDGKDGKDGVDGKDGKDGVSFKDLNIHGQDMIVKTSDGKEKRYKLPGGGSSSPFGGGGGGVAKIVAGDNITISPANGLGEVTINAIGDGTGDVHGPATSTDNAIARYDGITGKIIQDSSATIDDSGNAGLNAVAFDTTPGTLPTAAGTLYWDTADGNKTLSLIMEGGNVIQQIGEESYFRVKASSAITEGQVVMFTGSVGASGGLTGAPATGLAADTATYIMGVATENIPHNDWGYVTNFGLVRGINTTGGSESWVNGQILYYNPAVSGGLTKTAPTAPNPKVQVCAVVHADANGSVFVRPSFGGKLGQFEGDVQITSAGANDFLVYSSTNSRWENLTPTNSRTAMLPAYTSNGGKALALNSGATDVEWKSFVSAPSGSDTQVQFNDGGSFAGDSTLTFNKTSKTFTANSLSLSGNISASAWTTNGVRYKNVTATLTDTSSSGTVAAAYTNVFGGNTIAASNSTTYTNYASTYITGPIAGTNVSFTNKWALNLNDALKVSGQSLSGTQAQSLLDFASTWNTTGTPTALKLNVTDTASNSNSLLMDLQIGGTSKVKADKSGNFYANRVIQDDPTPTAGSFAWDASTTTPAAAFGITTPQVTTIHKAMRRCLLKDDGTVNYYLDPTDSTKKANGSAADLTGADGMVMVEIPKFYTKREVIGNITTWSISQYPLTGYTVHPAFVKAGTEVNYRYYSAYDACMWTTKAITNITQANPAVVTCTGHGLVTGDVVTISGVSGMTQINGQTVTVTLVNANSFSIGVDSTGYGAYTSGGSWSGYLSGLNLDDASARYVSASSKLSSVSGKYPMVGLTRANFRTAASNRGTGWTQLDLSLWAAVQLLYLIEIQSFYSQNILGAGNTAGTYNASSAVQNDSPHTIAGASNVRGNQSTNITTGAGVSAKPGTSYMSYRGIENFYGNCWKWVDGINVNVGANGNVYITNNYNNFADDTSTNMTLLYSTAPTTSNYVSAIAGVDNYFMATSVSGGSSSTYLTDYWYGSTSSNRVVVVSGSAGNGAAAGAVAVDASGASSALNRFVGARLAF